MMKADKSYRIRVGFHSALFPSFLIAQIMPVHHFPEAILLILQLKRMEMHDLRQVLMLKGPQLQEIIWSSSEPFSHIDK